MHEQTNALRHHFHYWLEFQCTMNQWIPCWIHWVEAARKLLTGNLCKMTTFIYFSMLMLFAIKTWNTQHNKLKHLPRWTQASYCIDLHSNETWLSASSQWFAPALQFTCFSHSQHGKLSRNQLHATELNFHSNLWTNTQFTWPMHPNITRG